MDFVNGLLLVLFSFGSNAILYMANHREISGLTSRVEAQQKALMMHMQNHK